MKMVLLSCLLLCLALLPVNAATAPAALTTPSTHPEKGQPFDWKALGMALGKEGELKEDVYTVRYPRSDLMVTLDGFDVPTGAGLETDFYFYRCDCGKMHVVGQFCLNDFEVQDVVDTLRQGQIDVAAISPMLLGEKPKLMVIRFQAEGQWEDLTKTLKSTFDSIGDARNPKINLN